MTVEFGIRAIKSRGRPPSIMAHIKRIILQMQAEQNCLAHTPLIAIAKVENDPECRSYLQGRKIYHVFQTLLKTTKIDRSKGAGITEIGRFLEHIRK